MCFINYQQVFWIIFFPYALEMVASRDCLGHQYDHATVPRWGGVINVPFQCIRSANISNLQFFAGLVCKFATVSQPDRFAASCHPSGEQFCGYPSLAAAGGQLGASPALWGFARRLRLASATPIDSHAERTTSVLLERFMALRNDCSHTQVVRQAHGRIEHGQRLVPAAGMKERPGMPCEPNSKGLSAPRRRWPLRWRRTCIRSPRPCPGTLSTGRSCPRWGRP